MHVLSIRYEVELLFDHYGTIGWTQLPYVIAGSPKQKERERSQRLFNERRGFREHVRQADRKGWRGASEARRKTKKEIVAVVWGGEYCNSNNRRGVGHPRTSKSLARTGEKSGSKTGQRCRRRRKEASAKAGRR